VLRFNATTLAAEGTLALPTPAPGFTPGYSVHVAAAGGTLVAGFGNKVEEIDPATGTVVGTIVVSSGQIVQDVAVSPAGDLIYVGAADASQTTTLTEWSVATGQLVGDRGSQASLGPVQLTATATGVWVSNSSGTLGGYDFRRSGDLGTVQGQPTVNDENLVHTRLARGVLWVLGGQLRCADPATGAIRATTRIPEASALVGDSRAMYVGARDGLDLLAPDPACFG
jgi:DNA-binding beta-propeller fold protein YncE